MTLKLKYDLDILTMYLQTENEVARPSRSKVKAWIEKHTKIALKVKNQGQIPPTFNHF